MKCNISWGLVSFVGFGLAGFSWIFFGIRTTGIVLVLVSFAIAGYGLWRLSRSPKQVGGEVFLGGSFAFLSGLLLGVAVAGHIPEWEPWVSSALGLVAALILYGVAILVPLPYAHNRNGESR